MQLKEFSKGLAVIADNFGFKFENEDWVIMLFNMAKAFTEEDIKHAFQDLCKITGDDWNKRYGYRGKPPIADWVGFFGKRKERLDLTERMARIERDEEERQKKEKQNLLESSSKKIISEKDIKSLISELGKKSQDIY